MKKHWTQTPAGKAKLSRAIKEMHARKKAATVSFPLEAIPEKRPAARSVKAVKELE